MAVPQTPPMKLPHVLDGLEIPNFPHQDKPAVVEKCNFMFQTIMLNEIKTFEIQPQLLQFLYVKFGLKEMGIFMSTCRDEKHLRGGLCLFHTLFGLGVDYCVQADEINSFALFFVIQVVERFKAISDWSFSVIRTHFPVIAETFTDFQLHERLALIYALVEWTRDADFVSQFFHPPSRSQATTCNIYSSAFWNPLFH